MISQKLAIEAITVETGRGEGLQTLVDGVSLTLGRGEVLALVGASGSGKSLTCAAALGMAPNGTRCREGRVTIDGAEQTPAQLRGRKVATIMQNPRSAFNPVRTMRQHGRETLKALGRLGDGSEQLIIAAMKDAGLDDAERLLGLHPFEMSGGMLQRMMIALALLSEAPFILADEPTTDLDLVVQCEVLELLEKLKHERGLGILLVTHDMGVVARLADRVAVMEAGRIIESGSVLEIFANARHATTRRLVEAHLSLYQEERAA